MDEPSGFLASTAMKDATPSSTFPATPDQWQQKIRNTGSVEPATPSTDRPDTPLECEGSLRKAPPTPVPCALAAERSEDSMGGQDTEMDVRRSHAEVAAPLQGEYALEEEVDGLRRDVAVLQNELHQQLKVGEQCLESERAVAALTVDRITAAACTLRDANVQLTAEVDVLRARVAQAESEAALAARSAREGQNEEGNEQLISVLQVEIADLERQLHRAHRARVSATETQEAATQRADILAQQLQQMVAMLEQEREENAQLISLLDLAVTMP